MKPEPYSAFTGYSVKRVPTFLFSLIDHFVSQHLRLSRPISSFTNDEASLLLSTILESDYASLESRTIDPSLVEDNSDQIIEALSNLMPRPKRLHNNNVYFRVVIPSQERSLSVPHRDIYFHKILPDWKFNNNEEALKVWLPLFNPSGKALGVIPGSHKNYKYDKAMYVNDGQTKQFITPHKIDELQPVSVPIGSCLIFPSTLVHGSLPVDVIDPLRVSVEISPVI